MLKDRQYINRGEFMKGRDFYIKYLTIVFTIVISTLIGDRLFDNTAYEIALVAAALLIVIAIFKFLKR